VNCISFPAVFAAVISLAASPVSAQQLPVVPLSLGIHVVQAEVANTFEIRALGLMYRQSMGANDGMLFVFPESEVHCMWMKNTLIPLAVAFVDQKGSVVSISEMQPQSETSHCAAKPAKYALEMNRGWFASKGIKAGSTIRGLEKAPPAR
jgi:uncharacterized membrane protein (UPF0127 family)